MTLRRRLLSYSLAQVGALGLLSIGAGLFVSAKVRPIVDEHLGLKTEAAILGLADRVEVPLASGETSAITKALAEVGRDPDLVHVEVRDRRGEILAAVGPAPVRHPALGVGPRAQDLGDALGAAVQLEIEGYQVGAVEVVFSKARERSLVAWMLILAGVVALASAVSVAVAVRFSRAFIAPIQRMIEFSRRLKDGGLSERVASSAGEGELARLAEDLNAMAEALQARDAALAQRGRELEESLAELRAAQEEILRSTRLASVGEMAGRTAHEVLNPMTGITYRLGKMVRYEVEAMAPNVATLHEIVEAWRAAYRQGGTGELIRLLGSPLHGQAAPLIEEDLDNLEGIAAYLVDAHRDRTADLQFLVRESDRVIHIVDGMRSLTRQSGTPIRAPVGELLRESVESVADGAARRHVSLRMTGRPDAEVRVDRYEFVQVVTNLLRNAVLAVEERSGQDGGRVRVVTQVVEDRVEVRVDDDGCGIASEHVPHLFEASFTTRSARDGTGLGLGIARRLARGFGGELRLERSEVGQGTTFLLEIPLAGVPTDNMEPVRHAQ